MPDHFSDRFPLLFIWQGEEGQKTLHVLDAQLSLAVDLVAVWLDELTQGRVGLFGYSVRIMMKREKKYRLLLTCTSLLPGPSVME